MQNKLCFFVRKIQLGSYFDRNLNLQLINTERKLTSTTIRRRHYVTVALRKMIKKDRRLFITLCISVSRLYR